MDLSIKVCDINTVAMSGLKVFWGALLLFVMYVLLSTAHSRVLRCDLHDPHGRDSEICWKQFLLKNYPQVPLLVQETIPDAPVPSVHARNAELSSALMQLYGFNNKFNGKRNPDFSRDVMRYMSDVNQYKEID